MYSMINLKSIILWEICVLYWLPGLSQAPTGRWYALSSPGLVSPFGQENTPGRCYTKITVKKRKIRIVNRHSDKSTTKQKYKIISRKNTGGIWQIVTVPKGGKQVTIYLDKRSEELAYFVYEHQIGKLPRKPPIFVRLYDKKRYRAIRKLKSLTNMLKNDFKGLVNRMKTIPNKRKSSLIPGISAPMLMAWMIDQVFVYLIGKGYYPNMTMLSPKIYGPWLKVYDSDPALRPFTKTYRKFLR